MRQVIISLVVAALAAFFASLADGLAELIKAHSMNVVSGAIAAAVYLAKGYKSC